jgi:hypothetical protein
MAFVTSELVITTKPKGKEIFCTTTTSLFNRLHTLYTYYHKNMHIFPTSVTIRHFRTLQHVLLASFPYHKFVLLAYSKVLLITGHEGLNGVEVQLYPFFKKV